MVGNFGIGNYGAGLENAIEVFENLEDNAKTDFLKSLRTLGSASGIDGLENLLNDFTDFLGDRTCALTGSWRMRHSDWSTFL